MHQHAIRRGVAQRCGMLTRKQQTTVGPDAGWGREQEHERDLQSSPCALLDMGTALQMIMMIVFLHGHYITCPGYGRVLSLDHNLSNLAFCLGVASTWSWSGARLVNGWNT